MDHEFDCTGLTIALRGRAIKLRGLQTYYERRLWADYRQLASIVDRELCGFICNLS